MTMNIESFKAQLSGGGARPHLFRVVVGFPSVASGSIAGAIGSGIASGLGAAAGGAASALAGGVAGALGAGGPAGKMEFLCKAASLPASTIGTIEVPFRGRILKIPGDRTFAEWQLTILNDNDFAIKNAFEEWMNLINSHIGNVGPSGILAITQTLRVDQLDRSGGTLKSYEFQNAWPSEVGEIGLDSSSTDTIEEFPVTFQYSHWVSDTTS